MTFLVFFEYEDGFMRYVYATGRPLDALCKYRYDERVVRYGYHSFSASEMKQYK